MTTDGTDEHDLARLLEDTTELVRSWRLRGFTPEDICAALAASGITAMRGAGFSRADMVEMIDHELGRVPPVRPTVKA